MKNRIESSKYRGGTLADLVCDPYFQDWVIYGGEEADRSWHNWLLENPEKEQLLQQARDLLQQIRFPEQWPQEQQVERSLIFSLEQIGEAAKDPSLRRIGGWRKMAAGWKVAAVVFGIVFLGGLSYLLLADKHQVISTPYAVTRTIYLPDSSFVVLNANSRLTIHRWSPEASREVWLEGEAFFKIRHLNRRMDDIKPYETFLVQTKDLAVEVLGTSFDVRQRRGVTEVVLEEGSIRVHFKNGSEPDIILHPGERLNYDPATRQLNRSVTVAADFSAWVGKKLVNEPSVRQIADYLEDNFGKKVIFLNPRMADKTIDGEVPIDRLDDALFVLSMVLNTEIIKSNDSLIFKPR